MTIIIKMNKYSLQQIPQPKGMEHLLGMAILVAFLLPHTSTLFLMFNPLLCLLLVYKSRLNRRWKPYVMLVVFPIVVSLMFNVQVASSKAYLSAFSLLLYFFCFPFVGKVRVRNVYLYICLIYIIVSQLVFLMGVPFLTAFFDTFYPLGSEDTFSIGHIQNSITTATVFDYRLGGLYHNANNCAEYLNILLAFFLVVNQKLKNKTVLLFTIIAYIGVLLTGSRTGFVVASLIAYFGLIRQGGYKGTVRYLFFALALIGMAYIVNSGVVLRGLDVESGFHNSANTKWNTFVYYLTNEYNIIALLFGHFDSSLFEGQYGSSILGYFDCEYGDLVYRFGFLGFLCIMLFWWKTGRHVEKSRRFFFLILLWCISSSVVAAYRAVFVFMLLLSVIYSNYYIDEKHKTFRRSLH